MKSKNILIFTSVIFSVIAFATLNTEMFVAYLEDAAAFGEHFARGFNLPEFSPFGFIPILTPIILILLLISSLPYATKLKALLFLSLSNVISFNHSLIALHGEMVGPVKWIVHLQWGIPVYVIAITLAEITAFFAIHAKHKETEVLS